MYHCQPVQTLQNLRVQVISPLIKHRSTEVTPGMVRRCGAAPSPTTAFHLWSHQGECCTCTEGDPWYNKLRLRRQRVGLAASKSCYPVLSSAELLASCQNQETGSTWRKLMIRSLTEMPAPFPALCLGQNLAFQCSNCESGKDTHVCSLIRKVSLGKGYYHGKL